MKTLKYDFGIATGKKWPKHRSQYNCSWSKIQLHIAGPYYKKMCLLPYNRFIAKSDSYANE